MPATVTDALPFAPDARTLAAALAELEELGTLGGGAIDATTRRRALARFTAPRRSRRDVPPRWRHDYDALSFVELVWSTGRARVPALPRYAPAAADAAASDAPALAVENAGGIVHVGSTYLEPAKATHDPRITLASLADAVRVRRDLARETASRANDASDDPFVALATAFQNCGAYVEVPADVAPAAPVQLVFASRPGEASAVFPHVVIRLGANARATIVERHVGESESFVAGLVDVELGPGARLDYVVIQRADDGARVAVRRDARCAAGATIAWHVADLGAALARTTLASSLDGRGAAAETNALFFANGFAHADLRTDVAHRAEATTSRTIVRTAATDRGQGRFRGGIRIAANAHRADAAMRDDALVLSRNAYLDATPALEIDAHDVSAAHAATVGTLDEETLFYVQSRGIGRGRAERMIALAFFEPAIARFPSEALRDEVRTALDDRLDEVPETFAS